MYLERTERLLWILTNVQTHDIQYDVGPSTHVN